MSQATPPPRHNKAPASTKDYGWDWSNWLVSDTIAQSTWTADPGLTIGTAAYASTFTSTKSTVWLSGGVAGQSYKVTNQITTSSTPARKDERSFFVDCVVL